MRVAAIIAAGGRGTRVGSAAPKQFLPIGERTMLEMSVRAFLANPGVSEIVVAVPVEFAGEAATSLQALRSALSASSAALNETSVVVVEGGERRQDSVANAFARVSANADVVLIHDAARPFVSAELIGRMIAAGQRHGAAIAALPARDTVKHVGAAGPNGERSIKATLPRDEIVLAQTPQAFRRDILALALSGAGGSADATDEAVLAERAGFPVHVVEGDPGNIKITTPEDLEGARVRRAQVRGAGMRIGTGYDLHRLVAGRPLVLAGVTIPFDLGLEGHSDADIVCHAVTDAILGAAAAGDIGRLFPDTDPTWKDADSIAMLKGALSHIAAQGYRVSNVDVTVIAQRPKLLPYLDQMRANLAAALEVDRSAVSIKGKTNEGVDSMGRGEAMACHAVALLR